MSVDKELVGARVAWKQKGCLNIPTELQLSCPMNQNPNEEKGSGILYLVAKLIREFDKHLLKLGIFTLFLLLEALM